jgi:hypothetical protein
MRELLIIIVSSNIIINVGPVWAGRKGVPQSSIDKASKPSPPARTGIVELHGGK